MCPGRCQCGRRPDRPSPGHTWDSEEHQWVGRGAREQRVAAKLKDKGPTKAEALGISVETWQKVPWALLTEYCQREKRPQPVWHKVKSDSGYRIRVVLADKKKAERNLSFCPRESSENEAFAKEAAALLALHHVQSSLPLERKLPEPFKSLWLSLVSNEKGTQVVDNMDRLPQSVTADRAFASKSEREAKVRADTASKNAATRRREAKARANPDARVFMAKRVRAELCELLGLNGDVNQCQELEDSSADALADLVDQTDRDAAAHVVSLGFAPSSVLRALAATAVASLVSPKVDAMISWLVTNAKDEADLPPGFDPDGSNLDVFVPSTLTQRNKTQQASVPLLPETAEAAWRLYATCHPNIVGTKDDHREHAAFSERAEEELHALEATIDIVERRHIDGFGVALLVSATVVLLVPFGYAESLPAAAIREGNYGQLAALAQERFAANDMALYDLCTLSEELTPLPPPSRNDARRTALITPASAAMALPAAKAAAAPAKRLASWWECEPVAKISAASFSMLPTRARLPAYAEADRVRELVSRHRVVLVEGGTGCGKTTQIPQFLLDGDGAKKIIVAQPRRLAAMGVASRVAEERGQALGQNVGCMVRGYVKCGPETALLFCTTGVVLRRLTEDPSLRHVTHLVCDEVHERGLDSDLLLALVKDSVPHVKVVLMSATVDVAKFLAYFPDAAHLQIPGRTYPVRVEYIDEQLTIIDVTMRVAAEEKEKGGAVLVFVASIAQVSRLVTDLRHRQDKESWLIAVPLHGSLDTHQQRRAFEEAGAGKVKVVVSTNVAETSITIPDVTAVVDTLRANESGFDVEKQLPCLRETWIAKDAAEQRAGRAGRVREGRCLRLASRNFFDDHLSEHSIPEIKRVSLEALVLQAKAMRLDPRHIASSLLDPPETAAIDAALSSLFDLGAIDHDNKLTPLGQHCAALPCAARLGKLLVLGATLGVQDDVLNIAAGLSVRSPWRGKEANGIKRKLAHDARCPRSDHCLISVAYAAFDGTRQSAERSGISIVACREIARLKEQFKDALSSLGFDNQRNSPFSGVARWRLVKAVVVAALYPQLLKIEKSRQRYVESAQGAIAVDGHAKELRFIRRFGRPASYERVFLHPESANFEQKVWASPWVAYSDCTDVHGKLCVRRVSEASPYALLLFCDTPITPLPSMNKIAIGKGDDDHQGPVDQDRQPRFWLTLDSHPRVAVIIVALREHLDRLLATKIAHPSLDITNHPVIAAIHRLLLYDGFY